MKNVIIILGCIGGICCLIDYLIQAFEKIIDVYRKYHKYKQAYEEHNKDGKPIMGFKTEKEQKAEIEARMNRK